MLQEMYSNIIMISKNVPENACIVNKLSIIAFRMNTIYLAPDNADYLIFRENRINLAGRLIEQKLRENVIT